MTLIRVREHGEATTGFTGTISFNGGSEYPVAVSDPFTCQEEHDLEWYFEEHLRSPFTEEIRAEKVANNLFKYGEVLFNQVFHDRRAFTRYRQALVAGLENISFEIVGSPPFHRLHWEALKDPELPQPLVLHSAMVRRDLSSQPVEVTLRSSFTINLLIVTARPAGKQDVGYRTVSRPLVEALDRADARVHVDLVRPGTYRELVSHLEKVRTGHYHIIHFDTHGALLTWEELNAGMRIGTLTHGARYGRSEIAPYDGLRAFLFLEGESSGNADPVEAQELADLLMHCQVPVVILNACQSGKQTGATETSLGNQLVQAGVQLVLAMAYTVTVSAAKLMMKVLYETLFSVQDFSEAVRRARLELFNDKAREAHHNQVIALEDWMLPVVYENKPVRLPLDGPADADQATYYERKARQYHPPDVAYGFVGRDLDILQIEKRLLMQRNELLIRGMGGAGKTTLLHHLGAWWQRTRLVDEVFYFGYDERPWARQQIMHTIAKRLWSASELESSFAPLSEAAQQEKLTQQLRAHRHLLILDNLESITGTSLVAKDTLTKQEQEHLHAFLSKLANGRTLVLLGSRGGEEWLAGGTFKDNTYELAGLDPEAASTLGDLILRKNDATKYREDQDYHRLLALLDGYPLALEVVLANLRNRTPADVLATLQSGENGIDLGNAETRAKSIIRCIDYSYSNLSPEAQGLLGCLAPFTSSIYRPSLKPYFEMLRSQPALASLPFDAWPKLIEQTSDWGLISRHPEHSDFLRLHPTLPYFLRTRLAAPERAAAKRAIEAAFLSFYEQVAMQLGQLHLSMDHRQRRVAMTLTKYEFENLVTALDLCLQARASFTILFTPLSHYLDAVHNDQRALELADHILACRALYDQTELAGRLGAEFIGILDSKASTLHDTRRYKEAETTYRQVLEMLQSVTVLDKKQKAVMVAKTHYSLGGCEVALGGLHEAVAYYHQALEVFERHGEERDQGRVHGMLGRVAMRLGQLKQAEPHQRAALRIFRQLNDVLNQAVSCSDLGEVAEARGKMQEAEQHYKEAMKLERQCENRPGEAISHLFLGRVAMKQERPEDAKQHSREALEIFIDLDDLHSQAGTYHQLGLIAQNQGEWQQAERYFKKSLDILESLGDEYDRAKTSYQIARVAEEQGRWSEATAYLLEGLRVFHARNDEESLGLALQALARVRLAGADSSLPAAIAEALGVPAEMVDAVLHELSRTGKERGGVKIRIDWKIGDGGSGDSTST